MTPIEPNPGNRALASRRWFPFRRAALLLGYSCFSLCGFGLSGDRIQISGRYPHLAMFNESPEVGVGAVVLWQDAADNRIYGRLTATARHLLDPANKVYHFDMEGVL